MHCVPCWKFMHVLFHVLTSIFKLTLNSIKPLYFDHFPPYNHGIWTNIFALWGTWPWVCATVGSQVVQPCWPLELSSRQVWLGCHWTALTFSQNVPRDGKPSDLFTLLELFEREMSTIGLGIWTCYLQLVTLLGDVVEPLGDGKSSWKFTSFTVWIFLLMVSSHVHCPANVMIEFSLFYCVHHIFFTLHLLLGIYVLPFPAYAKNEAICIDV